LHRSISNVQIGMSLRADGWAGAKLLSRGVEEGLTLDTCSSAQKQSRRHRWRGLDDLLGIAVLGGKRGPSDLAWTHALISPEDRSGAKLMPLFMIGLWPTAT